MAGDRRLGDRHDRTLAGAGVIFGDDDDEAGHHEADQAADEQIRPDDRLAGDGSDLAPADDELRRDGEAEDRQHAGGDEALVEGAHNRVVGPELDEERADDRGHDAGRADRQRIHHRGQQRVCPAEEDRGEHHGRNHGHGVGLEQVGRHARAVADVVADVVGDGRRVARIVLGNSGFDLAHQIRADVGALGEDAAAETGEDRDQRGAEAERDQRVDHGAVGGRVAQNARQEAEVARDAEQREAGDQKAGHRARTEGDVEAAGERLGRRLRRAHVGPHRDVHADEAGRARQDRADGEARGDRPGEQQAEPDEHDNADSGDGGVLPPKVGLRAFADRARNLLHALRAGVGRHQATDRVNPIHDGQKSTQNDQTQKHGV